MKKMMAMVMALVLASGISACGSVNVNSGSGAKAKSAVSQGCETFETTNAEDTENSDTEEEQNMMKVGGWKVVAGDTSLDKNADAKSAFEKATAELVGANYESVALLGTQIVAGTNYCILCRLTAVVPDAEPSFSLVYIYEDLEGNAEITDVKELIGEQTDGGFRANAGEVTLEKNEKAKSIYDSAMAELVGVDYEPIAYLGSQVVAGTNHLYLCRSTVVVPDAEPTLVLLTIYEDLDGNTEFLDTEEIVFN